MRIERQTYRDLREGAANGLMRLLERERALKLTRTYDPATASYTIEAILPIEDDATPAKTAA